MRRPWLEALLAAMWLVGGIALLFAALVMIVVAATTAVRAHEPYAGLKMPGTNMSCCGGRDCRPVQWRPGGILGWGEVYYDGVWVPVDPKHVLPQSIDGQWHACGCGGKLCRSDRYPPGRLRCVIAPPSS